MQSIIAFNAGEFAPDLETRSDIDYYHKACSCLENWDVSQMGGVRRRKGMRHFAVAMNENSRLIPYIYSYEDGVGLRFLVEVGADKINIWEENGTRVKTFKSGVNTIEFNLNTNALRYKQVNALLFLTCQTNAPLVLESADDGTWSLKEFEFKHYPWRYNYEQRDNPITLKYQNGIYDIEFSEDELATEKQVGLGDIIRASYWLPQQEASSPSTDVLQGVEIVEDMPDSANVGDKFAIAEDESIKYYVSIAAFNSDTYVDGLDMPGNYPTTFAAADDISKYTDVKVYSGIKELLGSASSIKKGTKFGIRYSYWKYWTCIKEFTKGESNTFEDNPQYFISGLAVGEALPCKGPWVFFCSGLWYGSYEVRRNYKTKELNDDWESRGLSFSRNEATANSQISGTEVDEECWLRLFITRSRRVNDSLESGFPQDSTGNKLIVQSYKHDCVLKRVEEAGFLTWKEVHEVFLEPVESRTVTDWSWSAFGSHYGYPLICETFNKRLVFAATTGQPQSVWFSRVDDINNFMTGKEDDAAISLTLLTTTQNPICWLKPRGNRIMMGTSEAEYIISSLQATSFTSSTATAVDHGYIGSTSMATIGINDKMLYVERGAGRVWTFEYSLEIDGWRSSDLTIFAPHIAEQHGGFIRASMIRKPDSVALYVLGDGQLALCTYNSLQEVKAWHRWTTDGEIKEVCGMPNGNNSDRIFFIVKREGKSNIEVVDEQSDYTDGGRDYTSLLVTMPLHNPAEQIIQKNLSTTILAYFGEPFGLNTDNLQVSMDGVDWFDSDMFDGEVTKGWHKFLSLNHWEYSYSAHIRVKGNQAFNILALQA